MMATLCSPARESVLLIGLFATLLVVSYLWGTAGSSGATPAAATLVTAAGGQRP
jgi:hypothetical protein